MAKTNNKATTGARTPTSEIVRFALIFWVVVGVCNFALAKVFQIAQGG